jgi:hypothetical protein
LPHLAHYRMRFGAMSILLKSAILMNTGLTWSSLNAIHTFFMPIHIIVMLKINRSNNGAAANATDVKFCGVIWTSVFASHVCIENGAGSVLNGF